MKRPRIEDIDASATIDPTWANMPRLDRPRKRQGSPAPTMMSQVGQSPQTANAYVPYGGTDRTQSRRMMKCHPFEIYQDQLDELRQLANVDKRNGGAGSMSAMVRDVLDRFIADRKKDEGST